MSTEVMSGRRQPVFVGAVADPLRRDGGGIPDRRRRAADETGVVPGAGAFVLSFFLSFVLSFWYDGEMNATETQTCRFPGCARPREAYSGVGRPPLYCDLADHNGRTAAAERLKLEREGAMPPVDPSDRPIAHAQVEAEAAAATAARLTAELLSAVERLERAADVMSDQAAVELEVDAVRKGADLDVTSQRAES
ncbi:MAG: hypothetical protein WBD40_00190, partial [Tepidisphaeraceae bacterium]